MGTLHRLRRSPHTMSSSPRHGFSRISTKLRKVSLPILCPIGHLVAATVRLQATKPILSHRLIGMEGICLYCHTSIPGLHYLSTMIRSLPTSFLKCLTLPMVFLVLLAPITLGQ